MTTVRVSLAEQLETRDGSTTKDELPTNCFVDGSPNHKYVTKRFGTALSVALGSGSGQGMFHLGSDNYAIKGDSLYRLSDSHNFTYTAPTTSNLQYQSITQPDNTKTIFKNTTNGYIFDGTTVSQIAKNGGVASITMTNNGWGGAVSGPSMTWNAPVTSNITGSWLVNSIVYGNGIYVAVGISSAGGGLTTTSYTSSDGITWTARTIPSGAWRCVAWNGTVFCAVASGAGAPTTLTATSPDGITWTQRTLPASATWNSISWNGTVFCAIAGINSETAAATSSDGITWNARTLPSSQFWQCIGWNGSVFCAIVNGSAIGATSPDGVTWTQRTLSGTASWNKISNLGSLFVVLAGYPAGASNAYMTSSDGINWTSRTMPASLNWSGVSSISNVLCVVASGSNNSYISNDGINWTSVTISGTTGTWGAISNNGSQFVTIDRSATALIANSTAGSLSPYGGTFNLIFTGGSGSGAAGTFTVAPGTVSNTIAFTTRTLPASANWSAIAFSSTLGTGAGRFCAIASGGTTAATSDDGGLTWTARTLPVSASWSSIAWNGTVFCAVSSHGSIGATSLDGITWTQRSLPTGFNNMGREINLPYSSISWSSTLSLFCAVTSFSSLAPLTANDARNTYFATSPDGITWTQIAFSTPKNYSSIAWSGTIFCAIVYGSNIASTSTDGVNWTQQVLPATANWSSISWNGTIFCAIAYNSNIVATSPNGIAWTQQNLPTSSLWVSITWNGGIFCAISSFAGLAATSPDGVNWTQTAESTTESWSAVASNTATGLIVGVASGTNHAMTGIAGVSSGSVVTTTITNTGSGYVSSAPTVSFSNCTGLTGATGIVNISSFPVTTVPGIAYLDGTYYVMEAGTNKIYGSGTTNAVLDNPAVWTPLNVVVANSVSGTGVAIARYYNYIVAFKSESIEYFYDAAGVLPNSPLAAVTNSVSRVGCASGTIVPIDNTIVFLSKSIQRGIQVSMLDGQSSVVISTPDVDRILNATNILGNSIYAFAIKIQGHSFYILTLKSATMTLGYDMVTKGWFKVTYLTPDVSKSVTSLTSANGIATATVTSHGYSDGDPIVIAGANQTAYNGTFNISYVDANTFTYVVSGSPVSPATGTITSTGYVESYFPVTNYLNNGTLDLLQHETDGDIYSASPSVYQDQGSPINVKIRTKLIDGGSTEKKHISKIEVIGDKVNSIAYVRYTNDDYQTFCGYRPVYLSQTRSMIRRCGSARRRAIDLRHTDNTAFRVESLELDIDKSNE